MMCLRGNCCIWLSIPVRNSSCTDQVWMKLIFLGTRGEIEARSKRHRMHSSLLVTNGRSRVMIDCGRDWTSRVRRLAPDAIILTHAHPDRADGLKNGPPCPVFATAE